MKKLLAVCAVVLLFKTGFAAGADTLNIPDYQRDDRLLTNIQTLENERILKYIFLGGFIFSLAGCVVIAYFSRLKSKQYIKIISLQNAELQKNSYKCSKAYNYMLNCAKIPCILLNNDGATVWANDSFMKFFGDDIKSFDYLEGCKSPESVKENLEQADELPVSFEVTMQNKDNEIFVYKRTVAKVKIDSGEKAMWAVIENVIN